MISFQIKESGKTIEINIDDEGINILIDKLVSLRGSGSHYHPRAFGPAGELSRKIPWGDHFSWR